MSPKGVQGKDIPDLVPGKWHDPAADRFTTADEAVARLEQASIYLGHDQDTGSSIRRIEDNVQNCRFIG